MAIQWRDNLHYLDSVKLPNDENTYWIKDTEAREAIEALSNATHFIGVSTTPITDGGSQTPTINGKTVTPEAGDIVIYKINRGTELNPQWVPLEFIYDGEKWQLLGDQSFDTLGDLAFKDSASGSYTPEGNVSLQTSSVTVMAAPQGESTVLTGVDISASGTEGEVSLDVSISGTVPGLYIDGFDSISIPTFEASYVVTSFETTGVSVIGGFSNDGYMPSINNTNTITTSVSGNTLIFGLSDIGFTSGSFSTPIETEVLLEAIDTKVQVDQITLGTADLAVSNIMGTTKLYLTTSTTYLEDATFDLPVSATFSGSSTTITVS